MSAWPSSHQAGRVRPASASCHRSSPADEHIRPGLSTPTPRRFTQNNPPFSTTQKLPTLTSNVGHRNLKTELQQSPVTQRSASFPPLPTEQSKRSSATLRWLPYALEWPYLASVIALSLILLLLVISVDQRSQSSHGLIDNSSSAVVLFLFKYVPTFIAVLYTLLISILLDDVKRTEPYARLAQPGGDHGSSTVMREPGSWWSALFDGILVRKREAPFSWPLMLSTVGTVLVLFIVSPLSSILLAPQDITIPTDQPFTRASVSQPSFHNITEIPAARSHTISHLLQNVTTSAWVSDEYVVLPFWPAEYQQAPLGASLGSLPQVWSAETTVLKTDMTCQPLELTSRNVSNYTEQYMSNGKLVNATLDTRTITLTTDTGCQMQIATNNTSTYLTSGSASWFKPGTYAVSGNAFGTPSVLESNTSNQIITYTQQCSDPEILLVMTEWQGDWGEDEFNTFNLSGHSCTFDHFFANLSVTAQISGSESILAFDGGEFHSKRRPITNDFMNLTQFEDNFMSAVWASYLVTPQSSIRPSGSGPAALLLALENFSLNSTVNDTSIVSKATTVRQRYFGEILLAHLGTSGGVRESVPGNVSIVRTRIAVVRIVAFCLEVTLAVEVLLLSLVWWLTRPQYRQLGLVSDPAFAATTASLITENPTTLETFELFHHTTQLQRNTILRNARFEIRDGNLLTNDDKEISEVASLLGV